MSSNRHENRRNARLYLNFRSRTAAAVESFTGPFGRATYDPGMMSPFKRYLAEEIALDHVEGLIPRREALRRLGLLGLGLPAATALLTACGAGAEGAATATPTPGPASGAPVSPAGPSPLPAEAVTFAGPEGVTLLGAWAQAQEPKGAVLVIHENRGLNDHTRSVAGRLAADGYSSLALDLLSREGGTDSFGDTAQVTAKLGEIPPERFVADMKAALGELSRRENGARLGMVGFCFGGGMTWLLLANAEPRLSAAAPFYGPLPDGADFAGSKAAVLGIYAELDDRVNATRDAARTALEKAGLKHEIVTFPGVGHAFFNDTGPRYNAQAAAQAYQRVIAWFGTYLA